MKYSGFGRQEFCIHVDMKGVIDFITAKIKEQLESNNDIQKLEISEYELDGETLFIYGNYDFKFSGEWFKQTLECPAEDEMDRPYIYGGYDDDEELQVVSEILLSNIPSELSEHIKITRIQEDEDDVHYYGEEY